MSDLPRDWRSMTLAELKRWLRASGVYPRYLNEYKRAELEDWVQRYIIDDHPTPTERFARR